MPEPQEPEHSEAQDQIGPIEPTSVLQFLNNLDPNAVPDARPLTGYLIKAPGDRLRLYLTLELNNYVEFSDDAVLALQPLNTVRNTLPSTIVLLRRDAPLWQAHRIGSQQEVQGGCNIPTAVCAAFANVCQCPPGSQCSCR